MRLISGALLLCAGTFAQQQPDAIVDFEVQLAPGEPIETFAVHVYRKWAPLGASRFLKLVDDGHFDGCAFFRVINRFMAQFGINGDPERQGRWRRKSIKDEVAGEHIPKSNTRGRVTFAHAGPNSRSTQLFINFGDNSRLDRENFPPFGEVEEEGMGVVDRLHVTGEGGPKGPGPSQGKINNQGDAYLRKEFPELSKIVSARRRPEALVPHRKGDIDGDGAVNSKDTAILEHYARLRGATLAPVAAKPAETPAAASGEGGPLYVWFAAATLFFVVASLRRRRAGKES